MVRNPARLPLIVKLPLQLSSESFHTSALSQNLSINFDGYKHRRVVNMGLRWLYLLHFDKF
jgi:hypothetical protein